jgi:HAE1 family hydrophobic/amphiphilic exporter-1
MLDRLDSWYSRVLKRSLRNKGLVIILAIVIFVGSLFLIGMVGTEFIPQTDEGRLSVEIELQSGTRVDESVRIARYVDSLVFADYPEVELISTSAGSNDQGGMMAIFMSSGTNIINYTMRLKDLDERERSVWDIAERLRNDLNKIPEIITYNIDLGGGSAMGGGNTVDVEIYGYDLDQTTLLANQISDKIKGIPGARDISISRDNAKPELQVALDREKMSGVGLNTAMVSTALYDRIEGLTATRYREGGEEYNVTIRFKEEFRNSISDIENIVLHTQTGQMVRLKEIGEVKEYWAPPNIERKRRERIVTVSAVPYKTSLGELAGQIQAQVDQLDIPGGILVDVGGAYEDQQDSFIDLSKLLLLSLLLVYIVMASQFESLKMPFIIMFSIPFAFTGVFIGLALTGTTLNVISGLGAIMLVGIVVKNAIVLVDYINLMRDRGYLLDDAITLSGKMRLRPVLMTALTTILGMLPLALSSGEGSEIWSPMGIAVISGLIVSTVVTMLLVPVIYRLFASKGERDKLQNLRKKFDFIDK